MAGRTISIELQADYDASLAPLCGLILIQSPAGNLPLTSLDHDHGFTVPEGTFTFLANPGYEPSALESMSDMGVDGGNFQALFPVNGLPISEQDVLNGLWNNATFIAYEVNWGNPTPSRCVELKRGTLGELLISDGMVFTSELRGLTQPFKQSLVGRYSCDCPTWFGSQESDSYEPCGFDTSPLWVAGTVTAVGGESDRLFTDSGLAAAAGSYFPGVVVWTSGDNAGPKKHMVGDHATVGAVGLRTPLPRNIQVGDEYEIRPDCTKKVEGPRGCRSYWGALWGRHFRGHQGLEKLRTAQIPGAEVGAGGGGQVQTPMPQEEA